MALEPGDCINAFVMKNGFSFEGRQLGTFRIERESDAELSLHPDVLADRIAGNGGSTAAVNDTVNVPIMQDGRLRNIQLTRVA
jgi:hypothetical protein